MMKDLMLKNKEELLEIIIQQQQKNKAIKEQLSSFSAEIDHLKAENIEYVNKLNLCKKRETFYRILAEKMNEVIVIAGKDGRYTHVSPSIRKYGYNENDILGKSTADFVHPDDMKILEDVKLKILEKHGKSITLTNVRYKTKFGIVFSDVTCTNMINQKGIEGIVFNLKNVTETVALKKKVDEKERHFQKIFNETNDAIFITDIHGAYLEVNRIGLQRASCTKEEFLKKNFFNINQFSYKNRIPDYFKAILNDGSKTQEFIYINAAGKEIITEVNGHLIEYEAKPAILHVSRDITLRKKHENEILKATFLGEEMERSRMAQDLHDGIGPFLSATKLMIKTLGRLNSEDDRLEIMDKISQTIDEIIHNVKQISNNLSPHILKNFGVVSALETFIHKQVVGNLNIKIVSNIDGCRFQQETEIAIYRILIELINNTLKYAGAMHCTVELFGENETLSVKFEHDGKGFNVNRALKNTHGAGLKNIINRVDSLEGKYKFISSEDSCFTFVVHFNVKCFKKESYLPN